MTMCVFSLNYPPNLIQSTYLESQMHTYNKPEKQQKTDKKIVCELSTDT